MLESHALGKSGLNVSPLGLGTVKFGRAQGVKYPHPVVIPSDQQAKQLLQTALDLGINLVDTAPAYGDSEARLGQLLKHDRGHWIICTKVGERFDGRSSHYDFSPETCLKSVHASLERLQTDWLDIVLIHSDGNDEHILRHLGTLDALKELRAAGKVRLVGISHKTVPGAQLAINQGADVIMAALSRTDQSERELIAAAADAGVGVLVKKALASGHANANDLAFVSQQSGVHCVVVGTTNPAHLRENANIVAQIGAV